MSTMGSRQSDKKEEIERVQKRNRGKKKKWMYIWGSGRVSIHPSDAAEGHSDLCYLYNIECNRVVVMKCHACLEVTQVEHDR